MGATLFADLARLRFGTFDKMEEHPDGSVTIYFHPLNSNWRQANYFANPEIIELKNKEHVRRTKRRYSTKAGTFEDVVYTVADEQGESPFLDGELNSEVPKMMDALARSKEEQRVTEAFSRTEKEDVAAGRSAIIKNVVEEQKALQSKTEEEKERDRRRQKQGTTAFDDVFGGG